MYPVVENNHASDDSRFFWLFTDDNKKPSLFITEIMDHTILTGSDKWEGFVLFLASDPGKQVGPR